MLTALSFAKVQRHTNTARGHQHSQQRAQPSRERRLERLGRKVGAQQRRDGEFAQRSENVLLLLHDLHAALLRHLAETELRQLVEHVAGARIGNLCKLLIWF